MLWRKTGWFIIDRRKNYHWCHFLQDFSTEETLKHFIRDCSKVNGTQSIKISKTDEYVKFKDFEQNIKSLFMI